MNIVGIDCATQPKKVGLALGEVSPGGRCWLRSVTREASHEGIVQRVASWIDHGAPCLIAIDAPLGWPRALGRELSSHQAGQPVPVDSNTLFRRETDDFVRSKIGKRPLEVGADLIARTAHAAVSLLAKIRVSTGHEIPLAWSEAIEGIAAIEVYPAATLAAYGLQASKYKNADQRNVREEITDSVSELIDVADARAEMIENDDSLDAAICVLAGFDFIRGRAMSPPDLEVARQEGWIWVIPLARASIAD